VNDQQNPAPKSGSIVMSVIVAAILFGTAGITIHLRRTASEPDMRSVAVLPFKPLLSAGDPALERSMTVALIDRLTRVEGLTVRPLARVQPFATGDQTALSAGRALKVEAVLDGYVRRKDEQIRINVRLLDVASGAQLWSAEVETRPADLSALQDSVVRQVAAKLQPAP
jgi:TolB-like protein